MLCFIFFIVTSFIIVHSIDDQSGGMIAMGGQSCIIMQDVKETEYG